MTTIPDSISARETVMTDRQLAAAVRFGRLVTVYIPEMQEQLTGYIMGFDYDNIQLAVINYEGAQAEIETKVRGREFIAGFDFHSKTTMSKEPGLLAEELERRVHKFRKIVLNEYFPIDRSR